MRQTVIGFFNNSSDAERAAERLRSSGFTEQNVDVSTDHHASSVSSSDTYDSQNENTPYNVSDESRYNTGSGTTMDSRSSDSLNQDRIDSRKDHDEGIGDSIGRFFRNLFDNKDEAERYASVGRKNSIVSVYAESPDEAERARDILDECGAVDVDEHSQQYSGYDQSTSSYSESGTGLGDSEITNTGTYTDTDSSRDRDVERTADTADYETRNTLNPDGVTDKSIQVIQENLSVGKREVESGGVRLRSRIVERPVEESLRLRQERVRVERVPVDRPATEHDFETFREGEIELTETSEVPIVNKEARVVEEVRLTKDVEERDEVVRDSVRQTDVDVENLSDESVRSKRPRKKL